MNRENILDNGFVLLKEDISIQSPVATVFYEFYSNKIDLDNFIEENNSLFQCVVGKDNISFGQTQFPNLDSYADQVDTVSFLKSI